MVAIDTEYPLILVMVMVMVGTVLILCIKIMVLWKSTVDEINRRFRNESQNNNTSTRYVG